MTFLVSISLFSAVHGPCLQQELTVSDSKMDQKRRLAYAMVKHLKHESSCGEYSEDVTESLEGLHVITRKVIFFRMA